MLQTLSWRASLGIESNKQGIPLHDGSAISYEEWKFRVMARWTALGAKPEEHRNQDRKELAAKILEGLSGDALDVAMDMGLTDVIEADGIPNLVTNIKKSIAGKAFLEAKELYREGVNKYDVLTRQKAEPMSSYVIRRSRWAQKLKELNEDYVLNDQLRADLLLELSGLTEEQQQLITMSIWGAHTEEKIAAKLKEFHPRIHEKEKGQKHVAEPDRDDRPRRGGFRQTIIKRTWTRGYAHVTCDGGCTHDCDGSGDSERDQEEQSDASSVEEAAFLCVSCGPDADFCDEIDRIEQDLTCAYLAAGFDEGVQDDCEEIAQQVHDECSAYFGREDARKKGVKVGHAIHQFRPRSELEIKERKEKVAAVKKNSKCRACGKMGHWAGDSECPRRQSTPSGPKPGASGPRSGAGSKSGPDAHRPGFQKREAKGFRKRTGLMAVMEVSSETRPTLRLGDDDVCLSTDEDFEVPDVQRIVFGEQPSTDSHHRADDSQREHSKSDDPHRGHGPGDLRRRHGHDLNGQICKSSTHSAVTLQLDDEDSDSSENEITILRTAHMATRGDAAASASLPETPQLSTASEAAQKDE